MRSESSSGGSDEASSCWTNILLFLSLITLVKIPELDVLTV